MRTVFSVEKTDLPTRMPRRWCRRPFALLAAGLLTVPAVAQPTYVTVQPQAVSTTVEAYGQVQPIADLPVKSPAAGIVSDVASLPGAALKPGDILAKLTGPEVEAALARAEAAIDSATAKRAAAKKTLQMLQSQLASHLSTAQQVAEAEAALADATGAMATAKAERATATLTATVRSPVAGTLVAWNAAAGERVAAGDRLATIEPRDQLWIEATLYGGEASTVHPGQRATFEPTAFGKPGVVEVVSTAPTRGGSGDVTVGLRPVPPNPGWRRGQFGRVIFQSAEAHLVAVPTQALILDQGKWWVLVHSAQGDRPVEVVPGPARGWQTFLRRGLPGGTQIVAQNAYLEFHRQIASRYQPPD